jgi:hypothetical protein
MAANGRFQPGGDSGGKSGSNLVIALRALGADAHAAHTLDSTAHGEAVSFSIWPIFGRCF